MRTVWLHGLESAAGGERVDFLNTLGECFAPAINYYEDGLYERLLNEVRDFAPDLIIGSSIGGYYAFHLGEALNIPTLLFNPALPYRTKAGTSIPRHLLEFNDSFHTVILGKADTVIRPKDTIDWLKEEGFDYETKIVEMTHRTDFNVFMKEVNNLCA